VQAQIKDQIAKHEPSWDEVQEEWETVQDIANSDNKMWDRIALTHSEQTQNESVNENTAFSILDLNNLQPNQCTMDPNQTQQPKQQWKQQDKKNTTKCYAHWTEASSIWFNSKKWMPKTEACRIFWHGYACQMM